MNLRSSDLFPALEAWLTSERERDRRQEAIEEEAARSFGQLSRAASPDGAVGFAGVVLAGAGTPRPPRWVDVYTSAASSSCDPQDDRGCALWRVRIELHACAVVDVARVAGSSRERPPDDCASGFGEVEPAVSPDETGLAYLRRCDTDGGGVRSRLIPRTLGEEGTTTVVDATRGPELPHWPAWASDRDLAWETSRSVSEGSEERQGTVWFDGIALLGPDGWFRADEGFSDPAFHPAPAYRTDAELRMLTFGGRDGAHAPRATSVYGSDEELFELQFSTTGETEECHHPAWNISGDRVACHRNAPEEPLPDGGFLRHTFLFRFDTERRIWIGADDGPTHIFPFPDPGALQDQLQSLPADRCVRYFVKYVEWCGTDEYALATIYCFDDDHRVVGSRVVFFRVGEDPPRFFDLTGAIARSQGDEEEEGDPTWSGVFGTCTPRHSSADWTPIAGGA